jgi:hypothetical protein
MELDYERKLNTELYSTEQQYRYRHYICCQCETREIWRDEGISATASTGYGPGQHPCLYRVQTGTGSHTRGYYPLGLKATTHLHLVRVCSDSAVRQYDLHTSSLTRTAYETFMCYGKNVRE